MAEQYPCNKWLFVHNKFNIGACRKSPSYDVLATMLVAVDALLAMDDLDNQDQSSSFQCLDDMNTRGSNWISF
jgi:hypothetical protein